MRWQKAETSFLDDYADFLGEVAGLGADAIEVWNEMNIDREWPTGQIDPRRYKVMLEKAYTQIKAANPDTIVITGALAPTGAEGCFWSGLRSGTTIAIIWAWPTPASLEYADCIGAHYNEGILPPSRQGGDPRERRVSDALSAADAAARGIPLPQLRYTHVHDRDGLPFARGLWPLARRL